MNIVYVGQRPTDSRQKSIFLAGPSPRGSGDLHWRPEALSILQNLGFAGQVFVPLAQDGSWLENYQLQIDWELEYLDTSTVIAFWIPRHTEKLPGFTSNVEFGMYVRTPQKVVLGYPSSAHRMDYLKYLAVKFKVSVCSTLESTMMEAINLTLSSAD